MNSPEIKILKQKTYDLLSVSLRSDGIMYVRVKGNAEIDVQHVKLVVETIEELGEGKKFPLLVVTDENTLPTPEARAYIASEESNPFASAEAYVVKSLGQKLAGNFFLNFNKPFRPTKIFNDETKAIEWLKHFIK